MCVCCNSGRKLLNPRLSLIQYKFFVVVVFFFFLGLLVLCCLPICREYLQQQLSPLRHINFAEPEQKRNIRRVKISHFSSSYVETTQVLLIIFRKTAKVLPTHKCLELEYNTYSKEISYITTKLYVGLLTYVFSVLFHNYDYVTSIMSKEQLFSILH